MHELQRLERIEDQQRLSQKIRRARRRHERPPTIQVYVTEHGIRRLATTKEDVEQVCINKNDAPFSQSSDTPLMQPPMQELIGFLAGTQAADQILEGKFQTDIYTQRCSKN